MIRKVFSSFFAIGFQYQNFVTSVGLMSSILSQSLGYTLLVEQANHIFIGSLYFMLLLTWITFKLSYTSHSRNAIFTRVPCSYPRIHRLIQVWHIRVCGHAIFSHNYTASFLCQLISIKYLPLLHGQPHSIFKRLGKIMLHGRKFSIGHPRNPCKEYEV